MTAAALDATAALAADLPGFRGNPNLHQVAALPPAERVRQNVVYATIRRRIDAPDQGSQYGTERGDLTYGVASVAVNRGRRFRSDGQPSLKSVRGLTRAEFIAELTPSKQGGSTTALVFVHGFATTWQTSIFEAAKLKVDIENELVMMPFGWTSHGAFMQYFRDQAEVEWSAPYLKALLLELLRSSSVGTVQIIVHSLGARAVVAAIKSIHESRESRQLTKLKDIVFACPDIDTAIMDRDYGPILKSYPIRTTLYVSNKDWAMTASDFVSGRQSVGSTSKGVYVRSAMTTIDVSDVDESQFGHSSLFQTPEMANDLHYLLGNQLPPARRHGLLPVDNVWGSYWRMSR